MDRLDDMDKAFGLGAVFGTGVTMCVLGITKCVRIIKTEKNMKRVISRMFEEIDESIKNKGLC